MEDGYQSFALQTPWNYAYVDGSIAIKPKNQYAPRYDGCLISTDIGCHRKNVFREENRVVVDCQLGDWFEGDLWDPAPEPFPDCPFAREESDCVNTNKGSATEPCVPLSCSSCLTVFSWIRAHSAWYSARSRCVGSWAEDVVRFVGRLSMTSVREAPWRW